VSLQIPDGLCWRGRCHPCPELSVELIEQAGLAHTGFPHYSYDLPVPFCNLSQEIFEEG
jgi:hypothetical protein